MENLLKVFFLLTIYFAVETDNFVIRSKKSHTKRMTKVTKTDQEPASSMNVTLHFTNVKRKDSEGSIENDYDDLNSYPRYKFAYKVYDPETGDDKEHEESRDGELVQGEYSFVEADGSRRIVKYISNGTDGFKAVITKLKAPTDTVIQQSQEAVIQQFQDANLKQDRSEVEMSTDKTESNHLANVKNEKASENIENETQKHTAQTQEIHDFGIINVENTTETQTDDIQLNNSTKRSDEPISLLPRKVEYLSANVEQKKSTQNQEKSKKRSVLRVSNNTPEPQFFKYMIAIPQNFYIPVNSNKDEVVSNYKENLKSAVKKQKKSRRNVQVFI